MGGGKSGGGTSTTTYHAQDPAAARRLAAVAEDAQAMAREQWEYFHSVFKPYEEMMVEYNKTILPYELQYYQEQLAQQGELLPMRTELERRAMEEQLRDYDSGLRDMIRDEQMREIERTSPVADRFYQEALQGPDYATAMGMASADVHQAFQGAEGSMRRDAMRMGLNPNSGAFQAGLEDLATQRAKTLAGARTHARLGEDQMHQQRMLSAMQARGGVPGLPLASGQGTIPFYGGQSQVGGYGLQSPVSSAQGFLGSAVGANQAGMQPGSSTTHTTQSGGGFGGFMGNLLGTGLGAFTGGFGSAWGGSFFQP